MIAATKIPKRITVGASCRNWGVGAPQSYERTTLNPTMKKTTIMKVRFLISRCSGTIPGGARGGTAVRTTPPHLPAGGAWSPLFDQCRNRYRSLWRGRPDEAVLHEDLRFLAGPANHLEGSF